MDKKDKEYFEGLFNPVKEDLHEVKVCLLGNIRNPDDLGLVGLVKQNTLFRKITSKALWLVYAALIGLIIKLVFLGG